MAIREVDVPGLVGSEDHLDLPGVSHIVDQHVYGVARPQENKAFLVLPPIAEPLRGIIARDIFPAF